MICQKVEINNINYLYFLFYFARIRITMECHGESMLIKKLCQMIEFENSDPKEILELMKKISNKSR
jgi:hypothetical protein